MEHATSKTDGQKREHLHDLVKDFTTGMLVTHAQEGEGGLRARPLAVAEAQPDGRMYFSTSVESPKAFEIAADAHVAVTFQDSKRYVSISGTASLTRDRALIDRLWSEAWKVWFPKGKADPTLAILVVEPHFGEYWDQSGLAGARTLLRTLKAYATGTKAADGTDDGVNAKVPL